MGRLILFLAATALLLGGNALLNWWVDPFGDFWKPEAIGQASTSRPQCLVSHEVIGGQYLPFKLDLFRRRPTRTFVIGSSRVLKIGARPGEDTFSNLGMPVISPEIVLREFKAIPGDAPPQTVYLGVEAFWFNPSFRGFDVEPSFEVKTRYVLSRSAFEASIRILRAAPYVLLHRWRKERLGRACVIGRSRPAIAWKLDGSRVWSFELQPGTYHPIVEPFTNDLRVLRTGNYADWRQFSDRRARILEQALALARARGWRVVGFTPPDGTRYRRFFESHPLVGPRWREFGRVMPRLFRRYGFAWLDLRNVRTIPCRDTNFVDGGYHTDAACSEKIRARLDLAAGLLVRGHGVRPSQPSLRLIALGDSIPAAVPRECGDCTGYVTLYARALARATKRNVEIENLAVPGSNSSGLRAAVVGDRALRHHLARADAIIVTIGHNDTPWVRRDDPCDGAARRPHWSKYVQRCVGLTAELLRRNLGSILTTIRALRAGKPTIVRVTNFHNDQEGGRTATAGADSVSKRIVDLYSRTICSVAKRDSILCADVYHVFNGVTGTSFDGPFVAADGSHPSQRGHRAIAEILARLGFAPLGLSGSQAGPR